MLDDIFNNNESNERNRTLKNHATTIKNNETNKISEVDSNEFMNEFIKQLEQKIESVKTLVIDRFEGNLAVCENRETGEMINVDVAKLPENVKEGAVLKVKDNEYQVDEEERKKIEDRIQNKLKNLFEE